MTEGCGYGRILRMGRGLFSFIALFCLIILSGCASPPPQPSPFGPAPGAPKAEKIVIEKSARTMTLYKKGQPWKQYRVALGKGGLAAKEREGDQRTPEGLYYIENRNPQSIY